MNLLNGLAVSDTGLIQAKAEIVSYTTQASFIKTLFIKGNSTIYNLCTIV
jgi:hypothetical protein